MISPPRQERAAISNMDSAFWITLSQFVVPCLRASRRRATIMRRTRNVPIHWVRYIVPPQEVSQFTSLSKIRHWSRGRGYRLVKDQSNLVLRSFNLCLLFLIFPLQISFAWCPVAATQLLPCLFLDDLLDQYRYGYRRYPIHDIPASNIIIESLFKPFLVIGVTG